MKKVNIKNKKIIVIASMILLVILLMISLYFYGLSPVMQKSEKVEFTIEKDTPTKEVIANLKESKLIKSKISTYIYYYLNNDMVIQAGTYELDRNFSTREIFKTLASGKVIDNSYTMTFKEGKRLIDYVEIIANNYDYSKEDILNTLKDSAYLDELINKYWFLTDDIKNNELYYSLEGYLFPDTYKFDKDATIKEIIEKILNVTDTKLSSMKDSFEKSSYSVHDILTMASIIENESMFDEDRSKVSQVIYKRLETNTSLGMDVTSYYGVRKALTETITKSDLNNVNPYNTRRISFIGLPVGPISNPSIKSIEAVFNPSKTNYFYFYADIKTGKLYFAETQDEFNKLIELYS